MEILVIDGQGGGLGRQLVAAVKKAVPQAVVTAIGKMCIRDRGNTAQFPPDGLSTAPAAAARHLRCQNAR